MNDTRRDFLKKAALVTGGASIWSAMPMAVQKAMAISANPGTTFYDAEHVVILMQENRSFDHCFGTMKGVRGYNDPRAISLPDKNPVWLQPDKQGNRFAPFRFDIKDTKATWMEGTPHSWENQVDARNDGKYDGWIEAKRPGGEFAHIPLTMGYYSREDLPFYYALADAFTVCDQHFCAALAGTTTNRSYFWTGKTHSGENGKPRVRNGELTYGKEGDWTTFPERLEDNGISWKVYQNEISLSTVLEGEDESLLANFTDNNLEWFSQFGVRYSPGHYEYLEKRKKELPDELKSLKKQLRAESGHNETIKKLINEKAEDISQLKKYMKQWNPDNFEALSSRAKNLHKKAFQRNEGDKDFHKTESLSYTENGEARETKIPKGDILHQFRKDVKEDKLPTVSWLVAPQKFSDHPSAPWYGAWYVSEIMNILTENPEMWKKTIFIVNYDENDGYFDHIPPFIPPSPHTKNGAMSAGLSSVGEFVTKEEEIKAGFEDNEARTSPVGLGYRVPLIIASPWSRGGYVNSEVCDITSSIQFLEKFLSKKTGKNFEETNISSWRRAVSGDLTSAFRPYRGEAMKMPEPVDKIDFVQQIYNAKFKELPTNFKALSAAEAMEIAENPSQSLLLPKQEQGVKPSNALKYDLNVNGRLDATLNRFQIRFNADKELFGDSSLGAPFHVYAPGNYLNKETGEFEAVKTWAFAVKAGDEITFNWPLDEFENEKYHLQVFGPNGFYREFIGFDSAAHIEVQCHPKKLNQKPSLIMEILVQNYSSTPINLTAKDTVYQKLEKSFSVAPNTTEKVSIDTSIFKGWYEFSIASANDDLKFTFAGRMESGKDSTSDPQMGGVI
jgi:phospholipase C